ncbi:hypothetical protein QTI19_21555, partial [Variovorax sp. J22R203]|uniref:hypothetical protein n=2 Tax=unclassified Variovorax TaxID=663243 RepID=UPI002576CB6B
QPLFAISRRSHFSEAFDYALLFQTASTSKEVFLPDSLTVNSEELTATHFAVAVSRALDYAQFSAPDARSRQVFLSQAAFEHRTRSVETTKSPDEPGFLLHRSVEISS